MMSSKVISVFLISALLVQCSLCSPRGIIAPHARPEMAEYGDGVKSMSEVAFDVDQITGDSFPSSVDGAVFYQPEERAERHADGIFNTNYRKALGQLSARKYLHNLVSKRVGEGTLAEAGPFSKRHADGVFNHGYSRYRTQLAVRKYLAAVLGSSPEDLDLPPLLGGLDLGALADADELELQTFMRDWLRQVPSRLPAL